MTPIRPDDAHSARAWAAFVAADHAASAPPSLEARVLLAAQAALAQKQRAEGEQARRRWFASFSAIAATVLAAAAWSLAPRSVGPAPSPTSASSRAVSTTAARPDTGPGAAVEAIADEPAGRPVPMTNIEAGRVLAMPPHALLASRPLFHPEDGTGPIRAPGWLRAKAFGAPVVEPVAIARSHPATPNVVSPAPVTTAGAPPLATSPALAGTAPEAWSSRGLKPVFDPETGDIAPPAPVHRLDQAMPATTPREDPPAPPK
ncbi:MAG: hypothetical protein ABIT71_11375 [Vicinamibacteraceae bacterium]